MGGPYTNPAWYPEGIQSNFKVTVRNARLEEAGINVCGAAFTSAAALAPRPAAAAMTAPPITPIAPKRRSFIGANLGQTGRFCFRHSILPNAVPTLSNQLYVYDFIAYLRMGLRRKDAKSTWYHGVRRNF